MLRGPPLIEYPRATRHNGKPPDQKNVQNGYPSCVVPRSQQTHPYPKAKRKADPRSSSENGSVAVHPMFGSPQYYDSEPLFSGRVLGCCVCGVVLAVILLYILYEYVRQQTEIQSPGHVDYDNVEFYNAIYTQRIADIIRSAQTDSWRAGGVVGKGGMTGLLGVTANPLDLQPGERGVMVGGMIGGGGERGIAMQQQQPQVPRSEPKKMCDDIPAILWGNVSSDVTKEHETLTMTQLTSWHTDLAPGGEWKPLDCVARYRLAVIIPYRDRLAHLTVLLAHLLPILKRQQLHFRIFVVEQEGNLTFNKGRIMNAAFKEALKMFNFQCAVFHDVDLIPEDDRNMYSCPVMPRHMSVAIDEMNYRLAYGYLVGGVLNMRVEHFQKVNGYSNMYWGWGAEDDDMAYRILHVGLKIFRPPSNVARYQMIKHKKRKPTSWRIRERLLRTAVKRYHLDGLNSVQYTVKFIHSDPLYTHIMVDIGKPDIRTER